MNARKRVRRNTKRFAEIFATANYAKLYTLDNCYCGEPVTNLTWIREGLRQEAFDSAEVYDNGDGTSTVHFHGRRWLVLSTVPSCHGIPLLPADPKSPAATGLLRGEIEVLGVAYHVWPDNKGGAQLVRRHDAAPGYGTLELDAAGVVYSNCQSIGTIKAGTFAVLPPPDLSTLRNRVIAMVDGDDGSVEWQGSLAEYIDTNEHLRNDEDPEELFALTALAVGDELRVGGGAQPVFVLRRVS